MCEGTGGMRPDCVRAFGEITTTQRAHGRILERIDRTLHGNGEPGLEKRVGDLEAAEAAGRKAVEERKDNEKWMRRSVIGAAVAVVVKLLLEWVRH